MSGTPAKRKVVTFQDEPEIIDDDNRSIESDSIKSGTPIKKVRFQDVPELSLKIIRQLNLKKEKLDVQQKLKEFFHGF